LLCAAALTREGAKRIRNSMARMGRTRIGIGIGVEILSFITRYPISLSGKNRVPFFFQFSVITSSYNKWGVLVSSKTNR